MISQSPDTYAFLQIDRPVIDGGRAMLAQASEIGRRILGSDYVSSISEFGLLIGDEVSELDRLEPVRVETPVTKPKLVVGEPNDLSMVILHRGVRPDLASRYSLGWNQGRFAAEAILSHHAYQDADTRTRGIVRLPSLREELDEISSNYEVDPEELAVWCDRVDVIPDIGDDIILGLFPKPSQLGHLVLHHQATMSLQRLDRQSSRTANPLSPGSVSVPFARVPGDVSGRDYIRLMEGLNDQAPVRLVLGVPEYSSKDRRSRRR